MKRKLLIATLAAVIVLAGAATAYVLLPKQYQVRERLGQTTLFWNDKEAFIFLDTFTVGRAQNSVQRRMASSRYGWLIGLWGTDFSSQQLSAYHLLASGSLDRPPLPNGTAHVGTWQLVDGNLQLTTYTNQYRNLAGFRWDGEKFVATPPQARVSAARTNLIADDEDDDDERSAVMILKSQRKAFKAAGWHWKALNGYEGIGGEASLPFVLGTSRFELIERGTDSRKSSVGEADLFAGGTEQLQITGNSIPAATTLWEQNGWQEIPKQEYERQMQSSGRRNAPPATIWLWLGILLLVLGWKVWAWLAVILRFAGVKRSVVKNMATSFSFPAALPSQFPQLDLAALENYTRDFESLGFTRLIDSSPTSDSPTHPAMFCRLMVHTGHHCYGEISQIFPRGKAPMALKCAISTHLQDGWSIAFSNRKPLAASSLVRRSKGLGVSIPDATPGELLQSLLTLRQQVCFDLAISPLTEDTLESYVAKVQQSAAEMRDTVKQKNFFTAIPQFYYRKLALTRTKPEYTWLGAYPKEAEQRKQGYRAASVG
jgi:hypothetical protein